MSAPFKIHEKFTLAASGVSAPFTIGLSDLAASCTVTLTGGDKTATVTLEGTNDPELAIDEATPWPEVDAVVVAVDRAQLGFGTERLMKYRFRVVISGGATAVYHLHRWKP